MKCTICGKPIVLPIILVPSAEERAKKGFGTAQYYRSLFKTHWECALKKRASETSALIKRVRKVKRCQRCQQLRINGIVCHETGCPNSRREEKDWI